MKQLEKEFVDKIIIEFEKHFVIKREIKSQCKKYRIDLILQLKENKNVFFGIECKIPNKKKGEEIGRFINQAIVYSNALFEVEINIFKKIPIFICPPLSYNYFLMNEEELLIENHLFKVNDILSFKRDTLFHRDRHTKDDKHHSFNGFLGAFKIGEVRNFGGKEYYFSLSNKIIFSSKGRYIPLINIESKYLHLTNYNFIIKDYE